MAQIAYVTATCARSAGISAAFRMHPCTTYGLPRPVQGLTIGPSSRMSAVQVRRWTRSEYERMTEAGVLTENDRVELIGGEVLTVTPQKSPHATGVVLASEALRRVLTPDLHVRTQLPLALGDDSEPEPDIAVVSGSIRDYRDAHPESALLVIEVSDSTLAFDQHLKGSLYAREHVAEYWIVNLIELGVEIYRDPAEDSSARFGWSYAQSKRVAGGESIPLPFGGVVSAADLLP
jgi:Uma2 family endonuclease